MRPRALAPTAILTAILFAVAPAHANAALQAAAGGNKGSGGFAGLVNFVNKLATDLVFVAAAAGVLGIIAGGGMLIVGSPEGGKWLARTAIGVAIVLTAKGIMA